MNLGIQIFNVNFINIIRLTMLSNSCLTSIVTAPLLIRRLEIRFCGKYDVSDLRGLSVPGFVVFAEQFESLSSNPKSLGTDYVSNVPRASIASGKRGSDFLFGENAF